MQSSVPLTRGTPAAYAPAAPRVAVRSLRSFDRSAREHAVGRARGQKERLVRGWRLRAGHVGSVATRLSGGVEDLLPNSNGWVTDGQVLQCLDSLLFRPDPTGGEGMC